MYEQQAAAPEPRGRWWIFNFAIFSPRLPTKANQLQLSMFEIRVDPVPDGLPAKANGLHLPVFEVGVFPLLDRLPTKANELYLPRFVIRVFLLIRLCWSTAPSFVLSGATLPREGFPHHCHLGDAPLRHIASARGKHS